MDRPFVDELRIENYGCIRDATFRFTPLHALIGPNDSGKSTVLRALRTLGYLLGGGSDETRAALANAMVAAAPADVQRRIDVSAGDASALFGFNRAASLVWRGYGRGARPAADALRGAVGASFEPFGASLPSPAVVGALRGTQLLRLDPDALRRPCPLLADGRPLVFSDEHGAGLPALYDALIVRDVQAYVALNAQLTALFPSVKSVQLTTPSTSLRGLGVRLQDGTFVGADQMSEGLLYYLAYAILPHLQQATLLLVEEPENGLHPARIAEVMRVLRAVSEKTQVVIATHSPLVVNELRPEEVTVVTRSADAGTKATPIAETPGFAERAKVYALGELWLSYANGQDEAPLLEGGPRP
jgi:energy-coupling factor transporter ATP-binding protein EcfA2